MEKFSHTVIQEIKIVKFNKKMKNYNSVTEALIDYFKGNLSKSDFNKLYPKCRFK